MSATTTEMRRLRGTKRTCRSCAVRFYDLDRSPTVCPSCGIVVPLSEFETIRAPEAEHRRTGWRSAQPNRVIVAPDEAAVIEDEAATESDDDEAATDDTADNSVLLEDDGDDMTDVVAPDAPEKDNE